MFTNKLTYANKLTKYCTYTLLSTCVLNAGFAQDLEVSRVCPVYHKQHSLGVLAFSNHWYHSGRTQASYIAADDATGVGIEIHWFNSELGVLDQANKASCDRYRIIQSRSTNAKLFDNEQALQIDVPSDIETPFYDQVPMEFGRGTHHTPKDTQDKPWEQAPVRASTLAVYDTPFISDAFGFEGEHITVTFETCLVCQRDSQYDTVLACGSWGYQRDFIDEMYGWAEPEFTPVSCTDTPKLLMTAIENTHQLDYPFWLGWRDN